jgi:AcrR family transcriptional regulator
MWLAVLGAGMVGFVVPQRRDAGRPRGKPIERAILAATLRELAEHGLEGLSVARVAEASGVNKTTIYRRWPTRGALVAAALEGALRETASEMTDTGSLRGDLRSMLRLVAERVSQPEGRALVQAALADASTLDVSALSANTAVREQEAAVALVRRAVARGEWDPARHPPDAVFAMIVGAVMHRLLLERQPLTELWAETVVDVVARGLMSEVEGATPPAKGARSRGASASSRRTK